MEKKMFVLGFASVSIKAGDRRTGKDRTDPTGP